MTSRPPSYFLSGPPTVVIVLAIRAKIFHFVLGTSRFIPSASSHFLMVAMLVMANFTMSLRSPCWYDFSVFWATRLLFRLRWPYISVRFNAYWTLGALLRCTKIMTHTTLLMCASAQVMIMLLRYEKNVFCFPVVTVLVLRGQARGYWTCHTTGIPRNLSSLRACRLSSFWWNLLGVYPIK